MAIVYVRPSNISFVVDEGESVFAAAERHGYCWPTVCGGVGSCTTCYVVVLDGGEHVGTVSKFEREGLERVDVPPGTEGEVRLACQLTISGNVTVRRSGVRAARAATP